MSSFPTLSPEYSHFFPLTDEQKAKLEEGGTKAQLTDRTNGMVPQFIGPSQPDSGPGKV